MFALRAHCMYAEQSHGLYALSPSMTLTDYEATLSSSRLSLDYDLVSVWVGFPKRTITFLDDTLLPLWMQLIVQEEMPFDVIAQRQVMSCLNAAGSVQFLLGQGLGEGSRSNSRRGCRSAFAVVRSQNLAKNNYSRRTRNTDFIAGERQCQPLKFKMMASTVEA